MKHFENLIVQKFGGATLATPELVKAAAHRVADQAGRGPLIVIVSAMGSTTNSLIDLASQVSHRPARRELDMLLSVGERISMSLMSMALNDLGCPAISFTGSQAGIFTDDSHFNARIVDVKAQRVEQALMAGKVVILAGFQGVSPTTKEITTLGRGGSDVTAVAMAAAFGARRCEILKDVTSVYTADPRLVPSARPIEKLSYDQLADMTYWGAKVLHHRSAELARQKKVPLRIGPAADQNQIGTIVDERGSMYENCRALTLNSHETVLELQLPNATATNAVSQLRDLLSEKEIPFPQVLAWRFADGGPRAWVTGPKEILQAIRQSFAGADTKSSDAAGSNLRVSLPTLSSVTLTCSSALAPEIPDSVLQSLSKAKLTPREMQLNPLSVTVFLEESQRTAALTALHGLIPAS